MMGKYKKKLEDDIRCPLEYGLYLVENGAALQICNCEEHEI